MQITFICYTVLSLTVASLVRSDEQIGSCGATRATEFENCFARALMVSPNQTFPENIAQVETMCDESKDNLRCIKSFTESCLKGMQRQGSTLLSKGVRNNVKDFCKDKNGKIKAVRTSKCAKRLNSHLRVMMKDYANDYRHVNTMESKDKITGLCCGYHRFIARLVEKSTALCSPVGVTHLRKYIDNISGDIMNIFCSNYSAQSPQCVAFAGGDRSRASRSDDMQTFISPLLVAVDNF